MTKSVVDKLESQIQKQILDYLETLPGHLFWRNYVGPIIVGKKFFAPNPMAGMPDILGFDEKSRPYAIEVKKPKTSKSGKGKVAVHQREWIKDLEAKGVLCIIAYSLDDVIAGLALRAAA